MKSSDFIEKLKLAVDSKTLYVKGGFGAIANQKNKDRYSTSCKYNIEHADAIKGASADVYFFDCVCLIKGILWGWNKTKGTYGGATYLSNNVPDCTESYMISVCSDVSSDFKNLIVGELLYMKGHVGVYVGDGKVIECTPAFNGGVQLTNLSTYPCHKWEKHGKLPWVEYGVNDRVVKDSVYTVVRGDTLWGIAKKVYGNGSRWKEIYDYNNLKSTVIRVGQELKIKGE